MRPRQYKVRGWRGVFRNHPCFILGNAPSISKFDLGILSPFFTVGVNRIHKLFDPTILLWQDESLESDFDHIKAIKFCRDTMDLPSSSGVHKYYHFHLVVGRHTFNHFRTHVLQGSGNTGCLAAQLSIGLGCNPLILLGMTCERDEEGNDDFHGKNEFWHGKTLEFCRNALKHLKNECPVEIIDCQDGRPLEDIVAEYRPFARTREFYSKVLLG